MQPTRRDVLRLTGLGVLGAAGATALPWGAGLSAKSANTLAKGFQPFRQRFVRPPVARPVRSVRDRDGQWVDHFELTMRRGAAEVLPGITTSVFGYNGVTPGPTIKMRRGRRSVVRFRNHLPELHPTLGHEFTTSVHLHGPGSLPQFDGYASDVTPPGFYKDYHYPNFQHARTLWYHDHGVHHTAENAYSGLYAQYHLHERPRWTCCRRASSTYR